jgi:hypothetical protein
VSRLTKSQADDIAGALGGTLDSYLEDAYGGAEVTDPETFLRELAATLRKTVTGVPRPLTRGWVDEALGKSRRRR